MIRSLPIVFCCIRGFAAGRRRRARSLDPAKLRLASANVLVLDAQDGKADLRQGGRRGDAHRVADQAHDGHGRAGRQPAARRDAVRSTWTTSITSRAATRACGWAPTLTRARDAAARAHVVGEPRRVGAGAPLPRRHARIRRRDERQGGRARHDAHALRGLDRTVAAQRVDGQRSREARARRRRLPRDPRLLDDAVAITSRCSPRGQTLGFNNSNALVKNGAWDIQLQKTGYIREAGTCVVMLGDIASKPMVIVLLDSLGKYTRVARRAARQALARDRRIAAAIADAQAPSMKPRGKREARRLRATTTSARQS